MDFYRRQAHVLKLMAHPLRPQMLDLLRRDGECVCQLSAALRRPKPYVSQQLALLRNAGLIVGEKEGANVFYRLRDEQTAHQLAAILGSAGPNDGGDGRLSVAGCVYPKCRRAEVVNQPSDTIGVCR